MKKEVKSPIRRLVPRVALVTEEKMECPHCLRTFIKTTAEKHIPLCANIKSKPKPPPTMYQL